MGTKLVFAGPFAPAFTGPFCLSVLILVRVAGFSANSDRTGSYIDKKRSNFYVRETLVWRGEHCVPLVFNFIANLLTLILLSKSLYYAQAAQLNQGICSAMLPLACLYNNILSVFAENPNMTNTHFIGMLLMITSVVLLYLETTPPENINYEIDTEKDEFKAILFGVLAPLCISVKTLCLRKYPDYKSFDLGIDSALLEYTCYCIMYVVYVS